MPMEKTLIDNLTKKIESLIALCEATKAEINRMESTLDAYQDKLLAKNAKIEELETQIDKLKLKNKNLQLVDAFNISTNDKARAQRSIDRLIKEIDDCIAMMNI